MIETPQDLIAALGAADSRTEREAIYAAASPAIERQDVDDAAGDVDWRRWLVHRLSAGPVGEDLPGPAEAFTALATREPEPTTAHAYVFAYHPAVPAGDFPRVVLRNAALVAFSTSLGRWLLQRVALLELACGDVDWVFTILDAIPAPEPDDVLASLGEILGPTREIRDVFDTPCVQAWLLDQYRVMPIPVMPSPPAARAADSRWVTPRDVIAALRDHGAERMADAVETYVAETTQRAEFERHPAIQAIRRAAGQGADDVEVGDLPDGLFEWVKREMRAFRPAVARLGIRVLARRGLLEGNDVAALLAPISRACDLPLMIEHAEAELAEAACGIWEDLTEICSGLDRETADALVAVFTHPDPLVSVEQRARVIEHIDDILDAARRSGPTRERIVAMHRGHQAWRPQFEETGRRVDQWMAHIAQHLAMHAHRDRLDAGVVDDILAEIDRPWTADGVLPESGWVANTLDTEHTESDGRVAVLGALALLRAYDEVRATGDVDEGTVTTIMTRIVQIIGDVPLPGLMETRLSLLVELRRRPATAELDRGRLDWMIGRALLFLGRPGDAIAPLEAAASRHRAQGDADAQVDAGIELTKARVAHHMQTQAFQLDWDALVAEAEALVELPAGPRGRSLARYNLASVLKAIPGHQELARRRSLLEAALAEAGGNMRTDIVADLAEVIDQLGEPETAVEQIEAELDEIESSARPAEWGGLQFALGRLYAGHGLLEHARTHLEAAIGAIRRAEEPGPLIEALVPYAQVLGALGEHVRALEFTNEAMGLSREAGMGDDLRAGLTHADLLVRGGELTKAMSFLEDFAGRFSAPQSHRVALHRAKIGVDADLLDGPAVEGLLVAMAEHRLYPTDALTLANVALVVRDTLSPKAVDAVCAIARRWLPEKAENIITQLRGATTAGRAEGLSAARQRAEAASTPDERQSALHILLTLLPADDERLECALELAQLVTERPASSSLLRDIAHTLGMHASSGMDGIERLEQALALAERALGVASNGVERRFAARTLAVTWNELFARRGLRDQRQAIAEAGTFLARTDLPEPVRSEAWLRIAAHFAALGPVSHPEGLTTARQALDMADLAVEPDLRQRICETLDGTLRRIQGLEPRSRTTEPIPMVSATMPDWLVELAIGRPTAVTLEALTLGLAAVAQLFRLRPDRADGWATHLVLSARLHTPETQAGWAERMAWVVQQHPSPGRAFPRLCEAVADMPVHGWEPLRQALGLSHGEAEPSPDPRVESVRLFRRAVAALEGEGPDRVSPADAHDLEARAARLQDITAALADVEEALRLAGLVDDLASEDLGQLHITHGNVLRELFDPEAAIECYVRAEALIGDGPMVRAQLDKVWADALVLRHRLGGDPEDIREAERRVRRALTVRVGPYRVATLVTALNIAQVHPDLAPQAQRDLAVQRVLEIIAHDPTESRHFISSWSKLAFIADWAREASGAHLCHVRERLVDAWPDARDEIELLLSGNRPWSEVGELSDIHTHPAMMTYVALTTPRGAEMPQDFELWSAAGGSLEFVAWAQADPVASGEALLQVALGMQLDSLPDSIAAAASVAQAALMSRAAQKRAAVSAEDLQRATEEASARIDTVENAEVRANLRIELARAWMPRANVHAALHDAMQAAALNEVALAEAPAGSDVRLCALHALARDTRYRTDGDPRAHLERAEALYGQCIDEAEASGDRFYRAQALFNRAELRIHMGFGDRQQRLEQALADSREALRIAPDPLRRDALVAVAWSLNRLAERAEGDDALAYLRESEERYAEAERLWSGPGIDWSPKLSAVLTREMRVSRESGPAAGIEVWRAFRASFDETTPDTTRATAAHNLAGLLLQGKPSRQRIREALAFFEEALGHRRGREPRHAWETLTSYGGSLLQLIGHRRRDLPIAPEAAIQLATGILAESLTVSESLGAGDETARSAIALLEAARYVPEAEAHSIGLRARAALDDAMATQLANENQSALEAIRCIELGRHLAVDGAERITGAVKWIEGSRAEAIAGWLLRGLAVEHRRRLARQRKPSGVPHGIWRRWRQAVDGRDPLAIDAALTAVREVEPAFLRGDADLRPLESWLRRHGRSAAVAAMEYTDCILVVVIEPQADGLSTIIGRIAAGPSPTPREGAPPTAREARRLGEWLRHHVAKPIIERLGGPRHRLVWCGSGRLAAAPPTVIWPEANQVHVSTTLALPARARRPRARSTLIVGADAQGDLHQLPQAMGMLAGAAGDAFTFLVESPTIAANDHPRLIAAHRGTPTPMALLDRQSEHDLIVVLAHGAAKGADDDALLLVDADGQPAPLTAARIAERPEAFAGASVLLLSCDAGRSGGLPHRPSGLAGAFLAAGAREVVAPLQPVGLATAVEAGRRLINAFVHGRPLARALAETLREWPDLPEDAGPLLGRMRDPQKAAAVFVSWVG